MIDIGLHLIKNNFPGVIINLNNIDTISLKKLPKAKGWVLIKVKIKS